jgi:hypothetical protein
MTVECFSPPPDVQMLLDELPTAADFSAARLRRELRRTIEATRQWLALEEQAPPTDAIPLFDLELPPAEFTWLQAQLEARGYKTEVREAGSLIVYTP